jgi:hypothetical protein
MKRRNAAVREDLQRVARTALGDVADAVLARAPDAREH